MKRTGQQEAVVESFRSGTGDVCITARAGAGKTMVLIDGVLQRSPRRAAMMCAFNKRIADELVARLTAAGADRGVAAKTLHGIGYRAITRALSGRGARPRVHGGREADLARDILGGDSANDEDVRNVAKLAQLAKETRPDGVTRDELADLALDFGFADSDDEDADTAAIAEERAVVADQVLERSLDVHGEVSFADMLWLPLVKRWTPDPADLVCVDEAQDMALSQLRLAARVRRSGGRIIVCGDDRQAIYSWRGAAPGALERVAAGLRAQRLSLTVTFRCATSIVEEARKIVPDLDPAPGAPAGAVRNAPEREMLAAAQPGDFVLSRINAPLARMCLAMIRAGTPARIAGSDLGPALVKLVRRLAKRAGDDIIALVARAVAWRDREVVKAIAADRQERADFVIDQADTIIALADGCDDVQALIGMIERVFTDDDRPRVTCSTIHRAKGLEADRVWLLAETLDKIRPRNDVQELEEQNLRYVAITRARRELVYVR